MSNSFTSPPVLPDSDLVISGAKIYSQQFNRAGQSLNYSHAEMGGGGLFAHSYPDGQFGIYQTSSASNISRWRVPIMSTHHNIFSLYVRTTGTGSILVQVIHDGVTYSTTHTITAGNEKIDVTITTIDPLVLYAEVIISCTGTGSGMTIESLMGLWSRLSSPLPTTQAQRGSDYLTPVGIGQMAPDKTLSSRLMHRLRVNIITLKNRPRVLFNWAALGVTQTGFHLPTSSPIYNKGFKGLGIGAADATLAHSYVFDGSRIAGYQLSVHLYVINYSSPFDIYVCGQEVTISSSGWSDYTLNIPYILSEYQGSIPLYKMGVTRSDGLAIPDNGGTDPLITSLSIWGP